MGNKKISKNVFENILIAVFVMLYFIVINFAYYKIPESIVLYGLKVLSMVVLGCGITILEIAYKKDSGKIALNAIEILILAIFTLSISHIVEIKAVKFEHYILSSSYVSSLYYLFKAIIVFTKEKKEYLKSFSDIKEIVNNEPTKKKAEKREENNN